MTEFDDEPDYDPRPKVQKQAKRGRGFWWWLGCILTVLMVLAVGIVAVLASSKQQNPTVVSVPSAAPRSPAPKVETFEGYHPPHSDEHNRERVEKWFAELAIASKNVDRRDTLYKYLDFMEAFESCSRKNQPVEERVVQEPRFAFFPSDEEIMHCSVLDFLDWQSKQFDWAAYRIDSVGVKPIADLKFEVIMHHKCRVGNWLPIRWYLQDSEAGLKIVDWEDMRSGSTAQDFVSAALDFQDASPSRAVRRKKYELLHFVQHNLNQRRMGPARHVLQELQSAKYELPQQYGINIAECQIDLHPPMPFPDDDRLHDSPIKHGDELAEEIAEELIDKQPERLAAYPVLALACIRQGKYQRAKEACDAYLTMVADDAEVLALRGAAHEKLMELDNAKDDMVRALQLNPLEPMALHWQMQQLDRKKPNIFALLETSPKPEFLFHDLQALAEQNNDWATLVELCQIMQRCQPGHLLAYSQQLKALGQLKQYSELTPVLLRALASLNTKNFMICFDRYLNVGRQSLTAQEFQKSWKPKPAK